MRVTLSLVAHALFRIEQVERLVVQANLVGLQGDNFRRIGYLFLRLNELHNKPFYAAVKLE